MTEFFTLHTEYSPWLAVFCALAGVAYAWLMYSGGGALPGNIAPRLLPAIRFVLVFGLAWLLLNPYFKHLATHSEAPTVLLAIDNSVSVKMGESEAYITALPSELKKTVTELQSRGYATEIRTLNQTTADTGIVFNQMSTNLSGMLDRIASDYENKNLGAVVLLSDGIFNTGFSPEHKAFSRPVVAVGLGDTLPRTDLLIAGVLFNRIVYAGNKVPVMAEIKQTGFDEKEVKVWLKAGNKIIDQKTIRFEKGVSMMQVSLTGEAGAPGTRHHTIEVERKPGEQTYENNTKQIYQEVIKAKDKVLLAAAAPHPDLKAIKLALEQNENIELVTYIADMGELKKQPYDLAILHQLPNKQGKGREVFDLVVGKSSVWYVTGGSTDYKALNALNAPVKVVAGGFQSDRVQAIVEPGFSKFDLEGGAAKKADRLPPLTVPFGQYETAPGATVLFKQKIGNVITERPLWAFAEASGHKTGILLGEGLWAWRMHEALDFNEQVFFDDLVGKTVKYLSTKEDRRKFKVEPMTAEFAPSEQPAFKTEAYNDIYEKIFGMKITLDVSAEDGSSKSYSYYHTESSPVFRIDNSGEGVYKYTARAQVGGLPMESKGKFVVTQSSPETYELKANHGVLKVLAGNTGGTYIADKNLQRVPEIVESLHLKSVLRSEEEKNPLTDSPWPAVILILLATGEWVLRKLNGTT